MSTRAHISVLCGGPSSEREVSLVSGRSIAAALEKHFDVALIEFADAALPAGLRADKTVVFPALHGSFGEDGQIQALLEASGFSYAGSGPEASALCMDKTATKAAVKDSGFAIAGDAIFDAADAPTAEHLAHEVGEHLVLKPVDQGSSVGLHLCRGLTEITHALTVLTPGRWMAEAFVAGREMTVGILGGEAMGIVEIVPTGGVYDYERKYTPGSTEYLFPAKVPEELAARIRGFAESAFAACGCRDFGRVDFILTPEGIPYFLEINTIPGLTPTSLLPKSASCRGLDFETLALRMTEPALRRGKHPQLT
ncbi:D-alanine--D-alanine ligase [Ruficoccus sp. ZRK36]|uniref:D-alanine--D-alanine ligase family protein n=1 Tax=Ruficoccus sp. ZRK36 TaxID=2866311 RepID=UPI001C732092|nr:D-alanine--D-alanine ligase [Ruficoccus sp. ZRK36]QYY35774.1 D-alanine--D-alanine ligase [Ruficoccus sp. ZRK36]